MCPAFQAIASEAEAKQEYQRLSITTQASMAACWEHVDIKTLNLPLPAKLQTA
jgi:hypothetical protein